MPNGMSERSVLIEHCGVGGSVRKDTLYPISRRHFRFLGAYVLSVGDRIRPLTAADLLGYFLGCLGFEVDPDPIGYPNKRERKCPNWPQRLPQNL